MKRVPATHEYFGGNDRVTGASDRAFGLVFVVVFAVLGLAPLLSGRPLRVWSLVAAGVVLAITLVHARWLAPFNRLWLGLGLLLHRVVNPVVMALLFYAVITPMAWPLRLAGKDPLRLGWDPEAETYWIPRVPPGPTPDTMRHQF